MKASKIALSVFFALALAVVCLVAAVSVEGLALPADGFSDTTIWYAVGGFALGLISGIIILKYLTPRTLSFSSIALGSLAFIALAILLYYYLNWPEEEENSKVDKPVAKAIIYP